MANIPPPPPPDDDEDEDDAKSAKAQRNTLLWCLGIVIVILVGVLIGRQETPTVSAPQSPSTAYSPTRVCTDAWRQDQSGTLDHSKETTDHFDVVLTPECFSGWVRVPRSWNSWEVQFMSNEGNRHVGFWFFGWSRSKGPFEPNSIPDWNYPPDAGDGRAKWRMQGVGTLRYFRTQ